MGNPLWRLLYFMPRWRAWLAVKMQSLMVTSAQPRAYEIGKLTKMGGGEARNCWRCWQTCSLLILAKSTKQDRFVESEMSRATMTEDDRGSVFSSTLPYLVRGQDEERGK